MIFKIRRFFQFCILGPIIFLVQVVKADTQKLVYSTIPELAWIVGRIGGVNVQSGSLLEPGVNAHYVDAKPSFIMKLKEADMVCSVGLRLESAWLNRAIDRSFNSKLQSTHSCIVGRAISLLGNTNGEMDRSHGHLHAKGNPHFWYAPSRMIEATGFIAERLRFLAGDNSAWAEQIQENSEELSSELNDLLKMAKAKLARKSVRTVSQYHSDFDYLIADLDLVKILSIESKPGLPPSAEHLRRFQKTLNDKKVKVILSLPWDPKGVITKLAKEGSAAVVEWPVEESDYLKAFNVFVKRLDVALQ